ncbi:MAG: hypothetical protein ACI3WR_07715 [Oscillospiraceae bacterium]
MKRSKQLLLAITASLFLLTALPLPCQALTLEGGLSLTLPDSWEETELDREGLLLHAMSGDGRFELGLASSRTLRTNYVNNWKDVPVSQLEEQAEALCSQTSKQMRLTGWSLLEQPQMRFLVFSGELLDESSGAVTSGFTQYTTIVNGGTLQLTFYYDGALSDSDRAEFDALAESLRFDTLTGRSFDRDLVLKMAGLAAVVLLLIASLVWNILRYRRKHSTR